MNEIQLVAFCDPRLFDYQFSIRESDEGDVDENFSGYDEQGQEWRGKSLYTLRKQGKIIKQFQKKTVFLLCNGSEALLGDIRECPDGSWVARSCYLLGAMEQLEVYGFSIEFYAIIYLHTVMIKSFSFDNVPSIIFERQNESDQAFSTIPKVINLASLDAPLGYIQSIGSTSWMACSFYHAKNMLNLKVVGFSSEFFATRYLFQIAEACFPDLVQDVPKLFWQHINSNQSRVTEYSFDFL